MDGSIPPNQKYLDLKDTLEKVFQMRSKMIEETEWYKRTKEMLRVERQIVPNTGPINLNPNLPPVNLSADINKTLPNLMNDATPAGKSVLPPVRIEPKPQVPGVELPHLTEEGQRLLSNIKNVPALAQKIRTEEELQRQIKAVDEVRKDLEKADISPEKLTQVLESAQKAGYTPSQVDSMFRISEKMREINQMFTKAGADRGMFSLKDAMSFDGGRHLRRMYAALESPEEHYNNLVNMGMKEVADKFMAAYAKFESTLAGRGINTLNLATFESRKSLPKELQDQLGRIYEATYPFAKGNKIAAEQYARHDFLRVIAEKFQSDVMKPGYKKMPVSADGKYGALEGVFLPERVYKNVMYSMKKFERETGTWEKTVQRWKALKLINPASISRNIMSGAAMANVFGEVPIHKMPKLIYDAFMDMRYGTGRYIMARNQGTFEVNISKSDIDAIANKVHGESPSLIDRFDSALGKGMSIFSLPDSFWRQVVFNHHIDQGKSAKDAAIMAKQALFDYSNAPKWINDLSRLGIVPFAKFPFFAAKETAKAIYRKPAEVTKYTKMQNQVDNEDRDKIMPDYLKSKTLLPIGEQTRIVNGKEQKVQGNIDLSYILPFANDVTVGNPVIDALTLYRTGQNGLGMQVVRPGMTDNEKASVWAKFGLNSVAPAMLSPYSVEKIYNSATGRVDYKGRQYDPRDAGLQLGLGIKNVPINTDEIFQSKKSNLIRQMRDAESLRAQTMRDKSLSAEQRKERIAEYSGQIRKISRELIDAQQAYKRAKERGAL